MHKAIKALAEVRAREVSNGVLTLDQLGPTDQEGCWLAAEDEYIAATELQRTRDEERADYFRRKQRGEDV